MNPSHVNPSAVNPPSQYCYFFDDDLFDETDRPGFRRRVIVGDHLELWFWRIKGGAEGSFLHNHDANEQLGIIMRGALDFRSGGRHTPKIPTRDLTWPLRRCTATASSSARRVRRV